MNIKSKFGKLIVLLFVVGSIQTAAAQTGMMGRDIHENDKGLKEKLQLADEQEKKISDLRFEASKRKTELMSEVRVAELELRMMLKDGASRKEVEKKVDVIAKKRADMRKVRLGRHFEFKAILTPEQWSQWQELHEKKGGRMHTGFRGKKMGFRGMQGMRGMRGWGGRH